MKNDLIGSRLLNNDSMLIAGNWDIVWLLEICGWELEITSNGCLDIGR